MRRISKLRARSTVLLAAFLTAGAATALTAGDADREPTPLELFEERILPIFKSPKPSSCVQCHLAAVDLKEYILPSHEKTFASLRDQGLIDLDEPRKSKILHLIKMGEKDLDEGARLIHAKMRDAEYRAFAAWIEACSRDPELRKLPAPSASDRAGPTRPEAVIRHARRSRVVDSFARNVFSQRMRCFPCHTPHEVDPDNPKHQRPIERARELEEQFGERVRLFRKTPEATLEHWIARSRETPPGQLPLINLKHPRKSLIILKPTSKLPPKVGSERSKPSNAEPVSHMGGIKMHLDDQSYKSFVAWVEDYAKVVGDRYESVEDLPEDNWHASSHFILITEAPWSEFDRIQLFVHAWDDEKGSWCAEPVAFTQGVVTPRKRVAGSLFLLRSFGAEGEKRHPGSARLPAGRYLLKAFVDSRHRLADDPTLLLGEDDYYGQLEVHARWGMKFRDAVKVSGKAFEQAR